MEEKRKRLNSAEQSALIDLMAITDRLDTSMSKTPMQQRIAGIARGKWGMAVARSLLLKMCELLLDTVPVEQLQHMKRQLKHVRCWIYVGKQPILNKESNEGRFLNIDELNIAASAIAESCKFCDIESKQDRRQCPRAKLLDCLPADKTVPEDDCGWFETLGSI